MTLRNKPVLGIVCPMAIEVAPFLRMIERADETHQSDADFVSGFLDGRSVVVARSNVGSVHAAMTATLLCRKFGCDRLILSGVAGALDTNVAPGDVIVASRVLQHDFGLLTDEDFQTFHPGDAAYAGDDRVGWFVDAPLLDAVRARLASANGANRAPGDDALPRVHFGTIVSGDTFVASEKRCTALAKRFDSIGIDMESAAVAQVANLCGARWLIARAVSDRANANATTDIEGAANAASMAAAVVVRRLLAPVLAAVP